MKQVCVIGLGQFGSHAALLIHKWNNHMTCGALFECADEFDQVIRGNQRLVGGHDKHGVEFTAQCRQA